VLCSVASYKLFYITELGFVTLSLLFVPPLGGGMEIIMKNIERWKPSKYKVKNGRLLATNNREELNASSYLMAQLIADFYSDRLGKYASGKLLDLGCGKIPMYGMYKKYITDCVCIDWENTEHKNENVDIFMDITEKLPFDDGTFQTIICSDVLEHIFNPIKVLDEMVRVTDVGGYIMINTPFQYTMHEVPYDYMRYTEYFYKRYSQEQKSVELVECVQLGNGGEVVADSIGKIFCDIKFVTNMQKKYYRKASNWLGRKISARSTHMALGYGVVFKKI
jgi:ubiquinone/menaquinone biosynthesis C-methylase UbiE